MRKAGIMAGIFLTAFFFILAVRYGAAAQRYADIVTVVLEKTMVDKSRAAQIGEQEARSEETQGFCFWSEMAGVPLSCRETGGSSEVTTVLVSGNPELVVSGIGALAYQERGCFLDVQTASELFGTSRAAGQTVWCGDVPYVVCGTVRSSKRILVRQICEEDEQPFTMLSLYLTKGAEGGAASAAQAQQFLIRHDLDGEIMDTLFLNALVRDLLLLLPLILGGWLICMLVRQAGGTVFLCTLSSIAGQKGRAGGLLAGIASLLAAGAVAVVLVYLIVTNVQIPADMIPTQWSDFSFWTQWWEKQQANLLRLLATAQGEAQLSMLLNLILCVICNICAVFVGTCLILRKSRAASEPSLRTCEK